ncbi:transferase [Kipferlia bialata]|uniref:Phosphodiesterase n=1 Tax=Kipferlia bialata TaxID=797122 RepID=A0A9K3CMW8_9EUKA|nr:transferase [Kipferlia bialata]|eukprot:g691.t1
MTRIGGCVYVFGGREEEGERPVSHLYILHIDTLEWETHTPGTRVREDGSKVRTEPWPSRRENHLVLGLDGHLVVVGGHSAFKDPSLRSKARDSHEQKQQQRKRNIVVLMADYCQSHGWMDTLSCLRRETGIDGYTVCDNVDIELVLQQYEEFYDFKHGKMPRIVTKESKEAMRERERERERAAGLRRSSSEPKEARKTAPRTASVPRQEREGGDRRERVPLGRKNSSTRPLTLPPMGPQASESPRLQPTIPGAGTQGVPSLTGVAGAEDTQAAAIERHRLKMQKEKEERERANGEGVGSEDTTEPKPLVITAKPRSLQDDAKEREKEREARKEKERHDREGRGRDERESWNDMQVLPGLPSYMQQDKEYYYAVQRDIFVRNPNVGWSDIIGCTTAKRVLRESLTLPIRYPFLYSGIVQPWRGMLLYGPPGTGKTMLAKAAATECRTTFFAVSAATLVSKWRGDSEKLVRCLFDLARRMAPSTIFIDEADAVLSKRTGATEHEASRRLKTEMLQQIDGVCSGSESVFVLCASNMPWDLDQAVLRRLEKRIFVSLPDKAARQEMMRHDLSDRLASDVTEGVLEGIADRTDGGKGRPTRMVFEAIEQELVSYLERNAMAEFYQSRYYVLIDMLCRICVESTTYSKDFFRDFFLLNVRDKERASFVNPLSVVEGFNPESRTESGYTDEVGLPLGSVLMRLDNMANGTYLNGTPNCLSEAEHDAIIMAHHIITQHVHTYSTYSADSSGTTPGYDVMGGDGGALADASPVTDCAPMLRSGAKDKADKAANRTPNTPFTTKRDRRLKGTHELDFVRQVFTSETWEEERASRFLPPTPTRERKDLKGEREDGSSASLPTIPEAGTQAEYELQEGREERAKEVFLAQPPVKVYRLPKRPRRIIWAPSFSVFETFPPHAREQMETIGEAKFVRAASFIALPAIVDSAMQELGLYDSLHIPRRLMWHCASTLQEAYKSENPYHNSTHASDVTHMAVSMAIAMLRQNPHVFGSLEMLALILACASHDVQHPGYDNKFLCRTRHEIAVRFNFRSVLENHHAQVGWGIVQRSRVIEAEVFIQRREGIDRWDTLALNTGPVDMSRSGVSRSDLGRDPILQSEQLLLEGRAGDALKVLETSHMQHPSPPILIKLVKLTLSFAADHMREGNLSSAKRMLNSVAWHLKDPAAWPDRDLRRHLLCQLFSNKGCMHRRLGHVMSISLCHIVADGSGAFAFMHSWGQVHRGEAVTQTPVHNRSLFSSGGAEPCSPEEGNAMYLVMPPMPAVMPPPPVEACDLNRPAPAPPVMPVIVGTCLHFPPSELSALKAQAMGEGLEGFVSTQDALSAHLWQCITRARGLDADSMTRHTMAANARQRLSPPVPDGYFGNCALLPSTDSVKVSALLSLPLSTVSRMVRQSLTDLTPDRARAVVSFLEHTEVGSLCAAAGDYAQTNWSSFPMWQVDFGQGTPIWGSIPDGPMAPGCVWITKAPQGGLVVTLGMEQSQLDALQADPELHKYSQ